MYGSQRHRVSWAVSVVLLLTMLLANSARGAIVLIGRQDDGSVRVPTNQTLNAAGDLVMLGERPVDLALRPDGMQLAAVTTGGTYLIDTHTQQVTQTLDKGPRNFAGLAYSPDGTHLYYAKGADNAVGVVAIGPDGQGTVQGAIKTGAGSWPAGLSVSPDGKTLYVALFGTNSMGIVDLARGQLTKSVPVGSSPFGAYVSPDGAFVYTSNWGGPLPDPDRPTDPLFPVNIDPATGAAASGTISVYDVANDAPAGSITVGTHPTAITFDADTTRLYVANANEDTVSVIDITAGHAANPELERISVRPASGLPFGSMPNGLALAPDGQTLYVANGGNNAVAVIRLSDLSQSDGTFSALNRPGARTTSTILGFIPTEWYPVAVAISPDGNRLFVANNKGEGSLGTNHDTADGGRSVFSLTGSLSFVDTPDDAQLASDTARFEANNQYRLALADTVQPPRSDAAPVPVPARLGEPSVFKHVLYIIKENRTYDQVFGDIHKGNGAAALTQFPRSVSPNHHALADRFGLLDNYYASSVNSADGHQWTDEAVANVFAERVYGAFPTNNPRGIPPYGNSPLDLAPDSLFSNAVAHGVSLRNYGEGGTLTTEDLTVWKDGQPVKANWTDLYEDWRTHAGRYRVVAGYVAAPPLRTTQDLAFPNFGPSVPEQIRADEWLREFDQYVALGTLPQLSVMELGNDHTSGTTPGLPTPAAQVADNDLALGRIIAALSHSPYWQDTAVFVTEDDAQDGVDHVDGHRTVGLVVSAYNKQGQVDSALYNQTSMVRTIEQILGLPPINQFDLTAPLMTTLFGETPDLTPYELIPNQIPLDTLNPPASSLTGQAKQDALASAGIDFTIPDQGDPAVLNAIIWRATMGTKRPYPHFAWEKGTATKREDD